MKKIESLYPLAREDLLKYELDERGRGLNQKCLLKEALMPYRQSTNTKEWIRWAESKIHGRPILAFETKCLTVYDFYFSKKSKAKVHFENVTEVDDWKRSLLLPFQGLWKKYKKNYLDIHPEKISSPEEFRKINPKRGLNFLILKLELENGVWQTFLKEIAKHTGTLVQKEEIMEGAEKYFRVYRVEGGSTEVGVAYEPTKLYPIDFGKEFEEFYFGLLK